MMLFIATYFQLTFRGLDDVGEEIDNTADIKFHDYKIDMIRFTDVIAVLADSKEELLEKLKVMENTFRSRYKMSINKIKTKILVISKEDTRAWEGSG